MALRSASQLAGAGWLTGEYGLDGDDRYDQFEPRTAELGGELPGEGMAYRLSAELDEVTEGSYMCMSRVFEAQRRDKHCDGFKLYCIAELICADARCAACADGARKAYRHLLGVQWAARGDRTGRRWVDDTKALKLLHDGRIPPAVRVVLVRRDDGSRGDQQLRGRHATLEL
eukprot:gene36960-52206_t